jgi:hypothetical protein
MNEMPCSCGRKIDTSKRSMRLCICIYCNGSDQRVARQQLCKHGPTRNNGETCDFYAMTSCNNGGSCFFLLSGVTNNRRSVFLVRSVRRLYNGLQNIYTSSLLNREYILIKSLTLTLLVARGILANESWGGRLFPWG